jgi:IS5 family transposase
VHDRIVQITQASKVVQGRKMRVDTTLVESNIHYATDSSLLDDRVRVLTRSVRTELTGASGAKLQGSEPHREVAGAGDSRAARCKAPPSRERLKATYGRLLQATGCVVGRAKCFSR